ncbi:protein Z-dependent protease inhibitor [Megalops cyprinoides]|uniref:protein Z-dependent protease inhibitor n=1 Tax=Megalops cyprinoides TaxID=118141 RepID=UPI001863F8BF|nr:protein Z-dependent protease inhibitor [Megalops cyprinoides]XP_036397790.1 protein Z-dependent protease inhibitor [Megalops cyprinoides]
MKMGILFALAWALFLIPVRQAQELKPNVTELTTENIDFAMNLYRRISSHHDNNIFFSPLCMSTSLAMLSTGARGTTRAEIIRGLNLARLERDGQPELIPELFQQLRENYTQGGELQLNQATGLFVHRTFQVEKTFSEQAKTFFKAEAFNVDFTNQQASKTTINEYIKSRTGDKVTEVVSDIDPMTQLMLINTIFFQGKWELPFNPSNTEDDRFYVDKYNIVQVPMMFREDKYYQGSDDFLNARVLRLPYHGDAAMLILLPNKDVDYTTIDDEINAKRFLGWVNQLKLTKLEVQMPKFKMEQSYPMHKILPHLGIARVFNNMANLSGLSTEQDLKVSEVLHKAVIEVDEKGTTAAAATVTGITGYSLPTRFIINRPFFFFIYQETTNSLLFMGRVIDPTKM